MYPGPYHEPRLSASETAIVDASCPYRVGDWMDVLETRGFTMRPILHADQLVHLRQEPMLLQILQTRPHTAVVADRAIGHRGTAVIRIHFCMWDTTWDEWLDPGDPRIIRLLAPPAFAGHSLAQLMAAFGNGPELSRCIAEAQEWLRTERRRIRDLLLTVTPLPCVLAALVVHFSH